MRLKTAKTMTSSENFIDSSRTRVWWYLEIQITLLTDLYSVLIEDGRPTPRLLSYLSRLICSMCEAFPMLVEYVHFHTVPPLFV